MCCASLDCVFVWPCGDSARAGDIRIGQSPKCTSRGDAVQDEPPPTYTEYLAIAEVQKGAFPLVVLH